MARKNTLQHGRDAFARAARPLVGQRAPEIQPFGTIARLPKRSAVLALRPEAAARGGRSK